MLSIIIRTAIQLLAGVGIGAALDKFAADKLPSYPAGGVSPATDTEGKLNIPKLGYFILAGVIGTILFTFLSKKLKLKF
jgi:hypothetical protein